MPNCQRDPDALIQRQLTSDSVKANCSRGTTEAQIITVLRQAEGGVPVPDLCREHGISTATFYGWRSKFGGRDASIVTELKTIQHIQPGKPLQNACIGRYNRSVRREWLGQYLFGTIEEVKDTVTEWLWTYNHERPNMALDGITPAQKLRRQTEVQPSV